MAIDAGIYIYINVHALLVFTVGKRTEIEKAGGHRLSGSVIFLWLTAYLTPCFLRHRSSIFLPCN